MSSERRGGGGGGRRAARPRGPRAGAREGRGSGGAETASRRDRTWGEDRWHLVENEEKKENNSAKDLI